MATFEVRTAEQALPLRAREALGRAALVYDELFGVSPAELTFRVVFDEDHPDYEHDALDHAAGEIWMRWPPDDPALGEWTLLHELAHAYQFAFDPSAYDQKPSWIHEGWAEYAVWRFYRDRDPAEAQAFLRSQAESFLQSAAEWPVALEDVYARPWDEVYPACHLAVHWLAREQGEAAVQAYFRVHGREPWRATLTRSFGVSLEQLGREVTELARELTRPGQSRDVSPGERSSRARAASRGPSRGGCAGRPRG